MTIKTDTAAEAAVNAAARELHLPTVRAEAVRLAEIAVRERRTHLGYARPSPMSRWVLPVPESPSMTTGSPASR